MSAFYPGIALHLRFSPPFDRIRARTALWSHPGICGPTNREGDYLAPQFPGLPWTMELHGKTDPFGGGQWVRITSHGDGDTLVFLLDARDLAAYGLMENAQCEGRARLWWERYLAEVAFAVHARTPITEATTGFVSEPNQSPASGLGLRYTLQSGLQLIERTPPTLDTSEVRALVEKFMCLDAAPATIQAAADRLEATWLSALGWEQLADEHALARAWEILTVLSALHDGGVLPEDGPAMLRLLDASPQRSAIEFERWRSYLNSIDPDARYDRLCEVYVAPEDSEAK